VRFNPSLFFLSARNLMGKGPRIRTSNEAYCLNLYSADIALGWRVIRTVRQCQGAKKVQLGEWRMVLNELGEHIGYQVLANFRTDRDLPSGASSTSITVTEILLNALTIFRDGRSRTKGLSEEKRITRHRHIDGKALPPEDAVERAQAKVAAWPRPASHVIPGDQDSPMGDRAVRVYPKTS